MLQLPAGSPHFARVKNLALSTPTDTPVVSLMAFEERNDKFVKDIYLTYIHTEVGIDFRARHHGVYVLLNR